VLHTFRGQVPSAYLTLTRTDMKSFLLRLWNEEEGQDLVEYALLVVLLALAAITTLGTLANTIKNTFSNAAACMVPAGCPG
jgi:Flp pilus assembly pilin Flp